MTAPTFEFEARPYGPESTPEEVEAIRRRVSHRDEGIILYCELPVASAFSADVCFDHVEELIATHGSSLLLVDARFSERPSAATRKQLLVRVTALKRQLRHIAVVTATNPLIRVAAKFLEAALPVAFSVHDTLAEAEEKLRRVAS